MKVALIADALWLGHEAAMLRHLVVGLTDESVNVVLVLPVVEHAGQTAVGGALTGEIPGAREVIHYKTSRWMALRDWRLWGLRKKLEEMQVNVLHVMDESLVRIGLRLGEEMGLPVVVGCWSMAGTKPIAHQVRKHVRRTAAAMANQSKDKPGIETAGGGVTLLGVTAPITDQLRETVTQMNRSGNGGPSGPGGQPSDVRAELVRPGVMRSGEEVGVPLHAAGSALCVLVIGDGRVDAPMTAFLEGVAKVRSKLTQMQLFVYSTGEQGHRWWSKAQELGLLGQVCMVGPDPGSQRMLVRSDVVMLPQALGMLRTLLLTTMSAGRPVIAAADPAMDDLIDGQTARLLAEPTADQWAEILAELPLEVEALQQLGEQARQYTKQQHGIGAYAQRMIDVYRAAVAEPWKFGEL